jgi:hypothetical protein
MQALCQKQLALPLRLFGPEKGSRTVPNFIYTYVNLQGEFWVHFSGATWLFAGQLREHCCGKPGEKSCFYRAAC